MTGFYVFAEYWNADWNLFKEKTKTKSRRFAKFKDCRQISLLILSKFVMRCAIWYHLYNLKNVKNTHGGVLILVKLHISKSA